MAKTISALRRVRIEIGGKMVTAWEPKDPALLLLGRWTDPEALLQRIHEVQHPEETPIADGRAFSSAVPTLALDVTLARH